MKKSFVYSLTILSALLSGSVVNAQPDCSGICQITTLCDSLTCDDLPWVTGSFQANGKQPIVSMMNGTQFQVTRLDAGFYAIQLKRPFCCPVAVVASSNFPQPRGSTDANVTICEAVTPGCFIIQIPQEGDACALVTFFVTPCT